MGIESLNPYVAGAELGIGLLGKVYGYSQASNRAQQAQNQLNQLQQQPLPRYAVNPMMARYGTLAAQDIDNPQGYTGAERGAFNQGIARSAAGAYANGTSMSGGNLSRAILANNIGSQVNAQNQFAAGDAGQRRNSRNMAFGRYYQSAANGQNVDNMNTQSAITRRMMIEQALGGAVRSNRDYANGEVSNFSSDLLGAGAMGMMGGSNGANPYTNAYLKSRVRFSAPTIDEDPNYVPSELN